MGFLDRLIRASLTHRPLVLVLAVVLLVGGLVALPNVPVDVLPDLTAPTVTVITEAPGFAPEEVELLVSYPLEAALNGAPGMRRLRSISGAGISVIWAEFDWGEDVYRARQVISERLPRADLPASVETPELGPVSSIMGEVAFLAITSDRHEPMELRRLSDVVVRRSILALPGVSQVIPIGGDVREIQVEVTPETLSRYGLSLEAVMDAVAEAGRATAAGFHVAGGQEYLVRGTGRARDLDDIASAVVRLDEEDGVPVRVRDVATVRFGPEPSRGTASFNGNPAVVLSVQKQPEANTLELTERLDDLIDRLQGSLPEGVVIQKESFRQASFIEVAVSNVAHALRDGAILVVLVLWLFLGNLRTTLISALALPLSLLAAILTLSWFGATLNVMTLGGLAIAIGALVDDAVIDVENVFRRLRQEHAKPPGERLPVLEVVFRASSEVRKAILFATLLILLVFLPLFVLPGLEGRLLRPLGFAYVVALLASLLVSLTVTPVLCSLLLNRDDVLTAGEPWLLARITRWYRPVLDRAMARPRLLMILSGVLLVATLAVVPFLGRSFLPAFNEGSLTISVVSPPGTPLEESDRLGRQVEEILLAHPEVVSATRRSGRAEKDDHVQGVNASELEVVLERNLGRDGLLDKEALLTELRREVALVPGVTASFGQPISHRIDHMISGSKTNLAVKIFGPDPAVLRTVSTQIRRVLDGVPGIVDLSNQEQATTPQLALDYDRPALARFGLTAADLTHGVEALFQGAPVGEVVEEGLVSRIVVRFPEELRRGDLGALPVIHHGGEPIRLDQMAEVRSDLGPSVLRREDAQRLAVLTANVAGTDLTGTVEEARRRVDEAVTLPPGVFVTFSGQFEEAQKSVRHLAILSVVLLLGMYGLLFAAFGGHRETVVVLVNLPLALIGGVFALWLGGDVLSVASLVGFITLFGIATRNGVLLVTHYQHLMREEGLSLPDAVRRGSAERLAPILMTALTAGLALVPLVLAGDAPGNEIQSPMARVILGGLVTSTLLNLVVVPALFVRWIRPKRSGLS